jgi:hypothetical protein
MTAPILILTEVALGPAERKALSELIEGTDTPLNVMVPVGRKRRLVVDFLDHLSMLEFRKAVGDLSSKTSPENEQAVAQTALTGSLAALEGIGGPRSGELIQGDPVAVLADRAAESGASQAIVVTLPHAVEDTLHTDWANQAQRKLGIPVLHLYAGTGFIGDS